MARAMTGDLAGLAEGGTLPRLWSAQWLAEPDRPTLLYGWGRGPTLSAAALDEETARAAAHLAAVGARAGSRVLWSCATSPASVVALLGALRLGAVVVPVNPASTESEVRFVAGDIGPDVAVVDDPAVGQWVASACATCRSCDPGALLTAGPPVPALDTASPADDALVVYTSGTTGQPKGAVHTHRSLLAGVQALRLAWDWQPDDRLILTLPLFHVHGLCAGLFGTLASGASALISGRFDATEVIGNAPGASLFFGVPTMYHRLAQSGGAAALRALRLCVAGSAPLPADLWHWFAGEAGVEVLERYGMSETLLTLSNPLHGERRPGSAGLPLPGVEAAVSEPDASGVGELIVRGPSVCRGYWNRPDVAVAGADGWFATGDLASVADDGYITIAGRRTELIITGGHNVYPAEVEAVLARHASVAEVAVVGLPSPEWGETVTAFVVGAGDGPDLDGLRALAGRELSSYKCPRTYRVVEALPRNALGKVLRRDLR